MGAMIVSEPTPRYMTVQEMAQITGFPEEAIRAAIRRGEMPHMRLGRGKGRGYWVRRDMFEQWLIDREQVGIEPEEPTE